MTPPASLAVTAADSVSQAQSRGYDLDDPRGAAIAFAAIADQTLELALPGDGQTLSRWIALASVAAVDVTLGRLVEAHADAVAILAELAGRSPEESVGRRWGVWAAEGPHSSVRAVPSTRSEGYELTGAKPWCSGAGFCTHALVTADGPAGKALYAVELDPELARARAGSWAAVGLAGSGTELVEFAGLPATEVGGPGDYLARPGFWIGAIGVAAVWWGGAAGIAAPLYEAGLAGKLDPHALAHLGQVEVSLTSSRSLLRDAADAADLKRVDQGLALIVRAAVEAAAGVVIERAGRALGPAPLCQDRAHARRVADLTVYLRQSHAERDLEQVGKSARAVPGLTAS